MQIDTARNASLNDLIPLLEQQHINKYDAVVPSTHMTYADGRMNVEQGTTLLTEDGVSLTDVELAPTEKAESGLASALGIPTRYLRRMREEGQIELLDHNVNVWLAEPKNWFIRGFVEPGKQTGIARAFLSDRYQVIDHLDAVTSVLDGIRQAGVDPSTLRLSGDLSESKLRLKITAPEITAAAPGFLRSYRNPSGGNAPEGDGPKLISAGVVVNNSETGGGAYGLAPHITIEVCKNGMTRTVDAMRRVHLGARMGEGQIQWSQDTKRANLELIRGQASDAVTTWLSEDYLQTVVAELEDQGTKILDRPHEVVDRLGEDMGYSETERLAVLDYFTRGGDTSSGGVVNAFTAFARDLDDPERAIEIEEQAFDILAAAAR